MKLGEPHAVGVFDDQGVRARQVDAGFDDRGANENVDLAADQHLPDILQLLALHLAVGIGDLGFGEFLHQPPCHEVDVFHAVVKIQHLAASDQLAADGIRDHNVVMLQNIGLHGAAIHGCFV